jgi:hypothetical protein
MTRCIICCVFVVGRGFRGPMARVVVTDGVALLLGRFGWDWEALVAADASMLKSPSRSILSGPAPLRFEMPPRVLGLLVLAWGFLEPPFLGPMGAIAAIDRAMEMRR